MRQKRYESGCGKPCIQALYGDRHYVLAFRASEFDDVEIFESVGGTLSKLMKLQLFVLFGKENPEVKISFPKTQVQSAGTNQCGVMTCCYMADLALGQRQHERYVEQRQRDWLVDVLRTGVLSACPNERTTTTKELTDSTWTKSRNALKITNIYAQKLRAVLPGIAHTSDVRRAAITRPAKSIPIEIEDESEDESEKTAPSSPDTSSSSGDEFRLGKKRR